MLAWKLVSLGQKEGLQEESKATQEQEQKEEDCTTMIQMSPPWTTARSQQRSEPTLGERLYLGSIWKKKKKHKQQEMHLWKLNCQVWWGSWGRLWDQPWRRLWWRTWTQQGLRHWNCLYCQGKALCIFSGQKHQKFPLWCAGLLLQLPLLQM